jgi:Protein of unknown function (DUF2441)
MAKQDSNQHMAESITDGVFYHVAHNKNYVRRERLAQGSVFTVGHETNPFFGYYDRARTYVVHKDGENIRVPALKFLRDVKNGRITGSDLPKQAYNVANHYSMLSRELIMEEVRRDTAPDAPSRKSCLWVVDNLSLAAYWQKKIGGRSRLLKLSLSGKIHLGDAKHLMNESEPLAETYAKAQSYWRSEMTDDALPEILFSGTATVLEDDLEAPPRES